MDRFAINLEARDPARNIFRYYRIDANRELFVVWLIDIRRGGIGNWGAGVRYSCDGISSAEAIIRDKLKHRRTARIVQCQLPCC